MQSFRMRGCSPKAQILQMHTPLSGKQMFTVFVPRKFVNFAAHVAVTTSTLRISGKATR